MNKIIKVMVCVLLLGSLMGCSKQEKENDGEFVNSKLITAKDGIEIYIGDPQKGKVLYNLLFSVDVEKFEEHNDIKFQGELITKVYEGEELVGEINVSIPEELYENGVNGPFSYDITLPKPPKEYSEFHIVMYIEDKEIIMDVKNTY